MVTEAFWTPDELSSAERMQRPIMVAMRRYMGARSL